MSMKALFHQDSENEIRRFFYLKFDQKKRDFVVLVLNRKGDEIIEAEYTVPAFLADIQDPGRGELLSQIQILLAQ